VGITTSQSYTKKEKSMNQKSILIVGTGALATLFAARLAAVGVSITMLGTWVEGLATLRKRGVKVSGNDQVLTVRATDNPIECKGNQFALVLVKSWQTERAAHQLAICMADGGVALSLQNGLGNDAILIKKLGTTRVARGVTTIGATLIAPGLVSLGGDGMVSLETDKRLSPLQEMLQRAGFSINVVSDLQPLVWGKLATSSAINPLTALLRVNNGELLQIPSARMLMGELARETARVANAVGVMIQVSKVERTTEEVARRTAENYSSMLQDVLRGFPTEIDAINGAVVQQAEEFNLKVPVNRTIWSLVKALPVHGKIVT
jgi:2-dehydropantoate 2-reductase